MAEAAASRVLALLSGGGKRDAVPGCGSAAVTERPECTAQGYRRFRCRDCGKQFNECSVSQLNRTQYTSDVIALVVLWRLRYRLSLRDLAEIFLMRSTVFSYEAVREWEAKLTPILSDELRQQRRRRDWHRAGMSTKPTSRFSAARVISIGQSTEMAPLVDVILSKHRDLAAAKAFFWSAKTSLG